MLGGRYISGASIVDALVKQIRTYLEENCQQLDLHIIHRFPVASCETASLLLGKILADKYPEKDIKLVKGTNSKKYEMHFWINADGNTFDITADQFKGVNAPLYGEESQVILNRFDDLELIPIQQALLENDFSNTKEEQFIEISNVIRN